MTEFRVDRLVSVGMQGVMSQVFKLKRKPFVPILMYHGIRQERCQRHPYFETNTTPEVFAAHLHYLKDHEYRTISLDDLNRGGVAFDGENRKVVLTFDDGYQDFYTHALPELARYGFRATVFIVSSFAENPTSGLTKHRHMDWREIRETATLGNSIGSHTVSHPDLQRVSMVRLNYELSESKRRIEQETGLPISSFAYPYAFPDQNRKFVFTLRGLLEQSGYEQSVSTRIGCVTRQTDRYLMPRIPVNTHDDLRLFGAKVSGAYDWLRLAQIARKYVVPRKRDGWRAEMASD